MRNGCVRWAGVILSGGASSRMGSPKALLTLPGSGETFLERIYRTMCEGGCGVVVCVAGCHADKIAAQLPEGLFLVRNVHWQEGQLSSLKAALKAVLSWAPDAVAVHLIDQPLIEPSDVRGVLLGASSETSGGVAIASYEGERGHPIALSGKLAEAVAEDGTCSNLREALQKLCPSPLLVACSPGSVQSANTPEELAAMLNLREF